MTWFKVDDSFHSHPKVLAAPPAALGLWVVAGSWSGATLSDGFVPDHVLPRLLPDAATLAEQLVAVGLWKRAKGGYRFHNWNEFNPNRTDVERERKAARERMQKLRTGRKNAAQPANGSGEQPANVRDLFDRSSRPRPDPKGRGGTGEFLGDSYLTRASSDPPSPRCEKHHDVDDPPPCGPCADARRARTRWDLADAERRRTQPQCRTHRGQPAHNCGLCRADQLVAREDA